MTSEKSRVSEHFTVTAGKRAAREKRSCLSYQVKSFGAVFAHKAVLRDRNMFAQISEKKKRKKKKKMKHVFIINPKSNSASFTDKFRHCIETLCEEKGLDYDIFLTAKSRDAENFAREVSDNGEQVRVYACGGDGTVNEVVNGIFGHPNAEFAVIPIGTGNDFIRTFGDCRAFSDIAVAIESEAMPIDAIRINDRICINIANIGFDAAVVQRVERLRKKRFVPKSVAYHLGVALCLIRFPKETLKIAFDDGEATDFRFLLTLFANAQYYGGGYRSASLSRVDDGLMDVITVKDVKRRAFVRNVSAYQKGTLLGTPAAEKLLKYRRCGKAVLTKDTPFTVCYDGEMLSVTRAEIECLPRSVRFVLPKTADTKALNCFSSSEEAAVR